MKKAITKLTLGVLVLATPAISCERNRVNIDSTLLSFVDGTDYIGIANIVEFAKNNVALLNGGHAETVLQLIEVYDLVFPEPLEDYANKNNKVGMIWFKDRYATIKELVEYEKNHPNDPDLPAAIELACSHFEKFSADYVEEIETAKDIMVQIISNWANLREKPHTLMLDWSKVELDERAPLYKKVKSFKILDTFLRDLLLFLKDLIQNCPKSHKQYRASLKKQE